MQILHNKDEIKKIKNEVRSTIKWAFFFSFFLNVLMLFLPFYSLLVFDKVLGSRSIDTLIGLVLLATGMFIVYGYLYGIRSNILKELGKYLDKKITPDLVTASVSANSLVKTAQGTQSLRDFNTVKNFFAGGVINNLLDAPYVLLFLIVMFFISPWLMLLALIGGLILLGIAVLNEKATHSILKEAGNANIRAMNRNEVATRNAEAIEAMGMMNNVISFTESESESSRNLHDKAISKNLKYQSYSRIIRMVIQVFMTGIGALLVISGDMSIGSMIAANILAGKILSPFEQAIGSWRMVIGAQDAYARLEKFIDAIPRRDETLSLPSPQGILNIESLIYKAPRGQAPMLLKGVNLALKPGDAMALIGSSAAGKSTLAKLIVGIWQPTSGHVRLDGANVYTWNRNDFGKHVGYLPQDVELFSGTVKDNIARMDVNANDEDIVEAARLACVHQMILRLPKGYETEIGEFGSILSAGQRQRIGLARALYGRPRLVVLDEPNSNLDQEGEEALHNSLKLLKDRNVTVVIVAHKASVLNHVDKIALLRKGVIEIFGPAEEVIAKINQQQIEQQKQRSLPQENSENTNKSNT